MLTDDSAVHTRLEKPFVYLLFALLTVAILGLHGAQFAGRMYRQDEAWVVHTALGSLERESLPTLLARNVNHYVAENAALEIWIALFGHTEPVTRYLSALCTAIGLALLFRLGTDLFDWRVALLAVFILGASGFYASHTRETRPYAALILGTVGLQLAFLRWMQRPRLRYALLYGLFGVLTFYVHVFVVYVFAAQAIFFALFVRWDRKRYGQAVLLFAALGLALIPRLLAALDFYLSIFPGGIFYAVETGSGGIEQLYRELQFAFEPLALLLQLAGLILPAALACPSLRRAPDIAPAPWRFDPGWRKGYVVALPLAILLVGLAVNQWMRNVTARNLVILLPSAALLMALGLRAIRPRAVRALSLLLMLPAALSAATLSSPNLVAANHPSLWTTSHIAWMSETFQPGSRVVIELPFITQHIPLTYYVQERLPVRVPNADVFHIMRPAQAATYIYSTSGPGVPVRPAHLALDSDSESLRQFEAFLEDAGEQLWYIGEEDGIFGAPVFRQIVEQQYQRVRTSGIYVEYRRIPPEQQGRTRFGETVTLRTWSLDGGMEAQPCQTITLVSRWQVSVPLEAPGGPTAR